MGRPATCACDECPKCKHRMYMKAYYQANRKTYVNAEKRRAYDLDRYHNNDTYRARHDARFLLAQQVRRGTQDKGPCCLCGVPDTVGHHNDYAKPLEGTWLCRECHEMIHNAVCSF